MDRVNVGKVVYVAEDERQLVWEIRRLCCKTLVQIVHLQQRKDVLDSRRFWGLQCVADDTLDYSCCC